MKFIKKAIAAILAVVIAVSVSVVSAMAVDAPVFKMEVVSETGTTVTVVFSLVSGGFNALDVTFEPSAKITGCTSFVATDEFKAVCDEVEAQGGAALRAVNKETMKATVASTEKIDTACTLYKAVMTKKDSGNITEADLVADITNCVIYDGGTDHDVTNSTKVQTVFLTAGFSEKDVSMYYRSKTQLKLDYSGKIVWSTSDEKIVTVDENGNIYGAKKGAAVITASTESGDVIDTCNVTVTYSTIQWIVMIVLFGWLWY